MIEAIGYIFLSICIVIGIVGFFWRLWDNRAMASGVLMAVGIVALIIAEVMT